MSDKKAATERLASIRLLLRGMRPPEGSSPVLRLGPYEVTVIGEARPETWTPGVARHGDLEAVHRAAERQVFTIAATLRADPVVVEAHVVGAVPSSSRPPPAY